MNRKGRALALGFLHLADSETEKKRGSSNDAIFSTLSKADRSVSWYTTALQWLQELSAITDPRPGYLAEYSEAVNELRREIELMEKAEADLITDSLRIRYYAALRIWPIRNETTPSEKGVTWADWYKEKFSTSLDDFAKRAKDGNLRQRIYEFEIARYGRSALEPKAEEKVA